MIPFNVFRSHQPKAKVQYITPKLAYTAKFGDCIVIKFSRVEIILLFEDGTYKKMGHNKYVELVKESHRSKDKNIRHILDKELN
jgi:hypothetical protein